MAHLINLSAMICQRVRSVRESDLWGRERPWEAVSDSHGLTDLRVRSASHAHRSDSTGRSNAFNREISQAAPRIGLHRPVCMRGRSDSQICEAVGVRPWPLTTKSCDLSERPCSASHGLTDRPHRSDSQICEADLWGRESPWEAVWESDRPLTHTDRTLPAEAMRLAVKSVRRPRGSDCIARCAWEADRHLGLPRPHRSERPCAWEAVLPWLAQTDHMTKVRGRERPCSSHWLRDLCQRVPDLSEPMRGAQPLTASHGLPEIHWKCLKI